MRRDSLFFITGAFLLLANFHAGAEEERMLYVSPQAHAQGSGTYDEPLSSLSDALAWLSSSGGTIRLLEGVYNPVVIPPGEGNLLLEAVAGKEVLFDGGSRISSWTEWDGSRNLYAIEGSEVSAIWDPVRRVRYTRQLDEAGVSAWPGSFCFLENGKILLHAAEGASPAELLVNKHSVGMEVRRNNTIITGVQFRNFLGTPSASAIKISGARNVEVADCRVENAVRGVFVERDAGQVHVVNCAIQDVATGISFAGVGLRAERCILSAAVGRYAIREEAEFDLINGIRFYHPAEQGEIRECLTAGFWAGLYQKTSAGFDGAKPFVCERNIFLDGIKTGTASQANNIYQCNIVAGGINSLRRLESFGAKVENNYFFTYGKSARSQDSSGNVAGALPFAELGEGLLEIHGGLDMPACTLELAEEIAKREVRLPAEILAGFAKMKTNEVAELFGIVCASSEKGAVITAKLSAPAEGVLKYRLKGGKDWTSARGISAVLSTDAALAQWEEVSDVEDIMPVTASHALSFVLLDGQLTAKREYEFVVEIDRGRIESKQQTFSTTGGPKKILAGGDGLQTLQEALDLALPGDTVQIAPGVLTIPAVLVHGGTSEFPLVIQGSGESESILDGGRNYAAMLELQAVKHVIIRDLQIRFFNRAGIVAVDCQNLTVERCRFLNKDIAQGGFVKGTGILLRNSPRTTVTGCLFAQLLYGLQAVDSPELTLTRNTAFKNLYSSAVLRNSSRNSRVTHNSFTFTGNISFYIIEENPEAFASLICNSNNYGTFLRKIGETAARAYSGAGVVPGKPEPDFAIPERYGRLSGSKRIIDYIPGGKGDQGRQRFFNMEDWREFSGKDQASIYADPAYVDPLRGDFRLLPESPNILKDGTVVGCGAVLEGKRNAAL